MKDQDANNNSNELESQKSEVTKNGQYTVDQALSLIGFGRVQLLMTFTAGLCMLTVINETMGMSILVPASNCDLELNTFEKGLLGGSAYFGILIPSFMWGYLCDAYGRRKIMIYTLFLTSLSSICSSFAPTLLSFAISRFMAGFFICAPCSSVYPYLGEFTQVNLRSKVIAWSSVASGLSMAFYPAISWLVLSMDFHIELFSGFVYRPWRLLSLAFTAPAIFAAVMVMYYPESPKYYVSIGRNDLALEALKWVYCKNSGKTVENFPVKSITSEATEVQTKTEAVKGCWGVTKMIWDQTRLLFNRPYLSRLMITSYMQASNFLTSAAMGLWFTYLTNQVSLAKLTTGTLCDILRDSDKDAAVSALNVTNIQVCDDKITEKAFKDTVMIGIYYVVALFLIAVFIQRIGRGYLLVVTLFGACVAGYSVLWVPDPNIAIALLSLLLVLPGSSISIVSGSAVHLFPTSVRTTAISLFLMSGRIATTVGTSIIGATMYSYCEQTLFITTTIVLGSAVLNFFLPWK